MEQNSVIVLGITLAAFVIIYIADVFKYRAIPAALRPILEAQLPKADVILAEYGEQLKPVHDVLVAAQTLIDQDTDAIVKALEREHVELLRNLFDTALMLTDGKAPEEAKSQGE